MLYLYLYLIGMVIYIFTVPRLTYYQDTGNINKKENSALVMFCASPIWFAILFAFLVMIIYDCGVRKLILKFILFSPKKKVKNV